MSVETKAVVTVAEMARMVGLSRARFYQLMGTAFPHPLYSVATRRPFYEEAIQMVCLQVRRRNCGVDGKPILFYARGSVPVSKGRKVKSPATDLHAELLDGLKALGLTSATSAQVAPVMRELFPQGTAGIELGEVIRAVFLRFKRQNLGDNVGR